MNWQPFMNNVYGICEFFRIKIVVVVVFQIGIIIALYSQPTFRHHQEAQVGHFCPKEASQSKKKKGCTTSLMNLSTPSYLAAHNLHAKMENMHSKAQ